ncbi:unnamed protein product [Heligmosomoides polygyrus]|uniref:Nucleolar GTP-binding protein 2 n=1 Tax=Heligmosomoides polygyrus TaxID=6339 RepID=A0A183G7N0_HELPZ|nr:unnamed protein product [Heligmosomoides polygyrus]
MVKKRNEGKNPKLKMKPDYGPVKNRHTFRGSGHSMNPDRPKDAKSTHLRSRATINRLRMYKSFKPIRDKDGSILKAAPYQSWLKSGAVARVEPNRKWFGNTRIVGQEQLQKFQENLGKVMRDPFQVVMKQTKLPISLLQEKAKVSHCLVKFLHLVLKEQCTVELGNTRIVGQEQLQKFQENLGKVMRDPFQVVMKQTKLPISLLQEKAKQQRVHVTDTESFEYTFGKKCLRKKPKLSVQSLEDLTKSVEERDVKYDIAKDRDLQPDDRELHRVENPNPLFKAGQSNRVWGELYKVLDSSDVVVQVIDARDPMGTRCRHVEEFLRKEKPHKHLVTVINKVDLVPTWVTRKWIGELSKEMPTIAFHASIQHSFGKGAVINLLRQFAKLHKDRQQVTTSCFSLNSILNFTRHNQFLTAKMSVYLH